MFYMYSVLPTCVCVCHWHAWFSWNWSYRWLRAAVCGLRIKPQSSVGTAHDLHYGAPAWNTD